MYIYDDDEIYLATEGCFCSKYYTMFYDWKYEYN